MCTKLNEANTSIMYSTEAISLQLSEHIKHVTKLALKEKNILHVWKAF